MTVKEAYQKFGGDYDDAMSRLLKEERVLKYLRMFAGGADAADMEAALADGRWEDAFRAVHNLKGISLNLGITPLAASASALCEEIRHGAPAGDITGMHAAVVRDYEAVTAVIAELE